MDSDFRIFSTNSEGALDTSSLGESARLLLQTIQELIVRKYEDVNVEVRKHRIVFGRLTSLRWFLDVMPIADGLILSIPSRESQNNVKKIIVRAESQFDIILSEIDSAYKSV